MSDYPNLREELLAAITSIPIQPLKEIHTGHAVIDGERVSIRLFFTSNDPLSKPFTRLMQHGIVHVWNERLDDRHRVTVTIQVLRDQIAAVGPHPTIRDFWQGATLDTLHQAYGTRLTDVHFSIP